MFWQNHLLEERVGNVLAKCFENVLKMFLQNHLLEERVDHLVELLPLLHHIIWMFRLKNCVILVENKITIISTKITITVLAS